MMSTRLLGVLSVIFKRQASGASLQRSAPAKEITPSRAIQRAYRTPESLASARQNRTPDLVDIALRGLLPAGGPARNQHQPLELRDQHAVLIEHARVHLDGAAVGLGL